MLGHEPDMQLVTAKDVTHQEIVGSPIPALLGLLDGAPDLNHRFDRSVAAPGRLSQVLVLTDGETTGETGSAADADSTDDENS